MHTTLRTATSPKQTRQHPPTPQYNPAESVEFQTSTPYMPPPKKSPKSKRQNNPSNNSRKQHQHGNQSSRSPYRIDYEAKYKQLREENTKLIGKSRKLQNEVNILQQQVSGLQEQNNRLLGLLKEKDSLYQQVREQLHEQIAVIEELEKQLALLTSQKKLAPPMISQHNIINDSCSLSSVSLGWKQHHMEKSVSTDCTCSCKSRNSNNQYMERIEQELGKYVEIKLRHQMTQRKLDRKQQENRVLRQQLYEMQAQLFRGDQEDIESDLDSCYE